MTSKKTIITIAGNVVVFTSAHTMEELQKVADYKPAALSLKNEDGQIYFSLLPSSSGMINNQVLAYCSTTPDGSGKACITIGLPDGADAKKAVAAKYGPIIVNANKVEAQIDDALAEVNSMLADVESEITIAGETPIEPEE